MNLKSRLSPQQFAKMLGVTVEQVANGMLRNADDMRTWTDKDCVRANMTRQQVNDHADDYERRAREILSDKTRIPL